MGAAVVNIDRMPCVQLHEAAEHPAAQDMAHNSLFLFLEGQLVGHIEFIGILMVKRSPTIRQLRQRIGDVVVRRSSAANVGASCEQLRVYVKQLRISVSRLEL